MSSAWIKIVRASKHLEALKNGIAADSTRNINQLILKSNGKETLDLPEPDDMIAVLAGEIIYQLRSALDHLAFDLVKLNRGGITLPTDWEENCAFPIWIRKPGQTPPLPYGVFKNLPGIPIEAHTVIERVQPYNGSGIVGINAYIRFLAALSNIDKHRRFALTRTRASLFDNVQLESGITSSTIMALEHGAEIPPSFPPDEPDPIVNMDRRISLFVAFNERDTLGSATDMPIEYFLEQMLVCVTLDIYNLLNSIIAGK